MTDPLFLTALICIGTACVLSYLLGRYLGMASAYESLRPLLPSDEAWGDCPNLPDVFHQPSITETGAQHLGSR